MSLRTQMTAEKIKSTMRQHKNDGESDSIWSDEVDPVICSLVFAESALNELKKFLVAHKRAFVAHAGSLNRTGNWALPDVYPGDTIADRKMKTFVKHGKAHADKTDFYSAIRLCDSDAKVNLADLFCIHVLRKDTSGDPIVAFSHVCVELIKYVNTLSDRNLLASVYANMELLIRDKSLAYYQGLASYLKQHGLLMISKATKNQIEFCNEKRTNIECLAHLVERRIDSMPPTDKLQPCDRLAAVRVVFDLVRNNQDEAMAFLSNNEEKLFVMNAEMFTDVFDKHVRKSEVTDKEQFARALAIPQTREANDFVLAVFARLDLSHALRALRVLEQGGSRSLSSPQRQCITAAFQHEASTEEEKFNLFSTIFDANFTPKALEAIGRLFKILMDRSVFIAALKSLKSDDKLLTDVFVELLEILHQKSVSLTFEYAKQLATVQCLPQFKAVMRVFPEAGLQAIFDGATIRTKPADWMRAFMVQAYISKDVELQRSVIQSEAGVSRQLVVATDLAQARLQPSDRMAVIGVVLDLVRDDQDAAIAFLRDNEENLFAMNAEIFTKVFAMHVRQSEIKDKAGFARALAISQTREDNDFVLAIFSALGLTRALRAMDVLEQKGFKRLSVPQKQCISVAFQHGGANEDEKFDLLTAMFEVNFTPQALEAIRKLYNMLVDRPAFIADLRSLKSTSKLFSDLFIALLEMLHGKGEQIEYAYARELSATANFSKDEIGAMGRIYDVLTDKALFVEGLKSLRTGNKLLTDSFVELLDILKNNHVSLTYAYAQHLATVRCLLQFKGVMGAFPEPGIQAIFDSDSVKAKPADWVRAFMLQARVSGDAELQRRVIQLVVHLWTYLEAHASEVGMSRDDLLGAEFNERFVEFLENVNIHALPDLRYALLADVAAVIGLLMPAKATSSSSPAPRGLFSLFGSRTPAALPAPEPEATMPTLLQRVFTPLGVIRIEGVGANARPVFSSPADIAGFARFKRHADMQRLAFPDAPRSYLAALDAPITPGPVVEDASIEEAGAEGAIVPYQQRPGDNW